jgi:hypothetical protein
MAIFLIGWKIHPYDNSLSALIGIWDGFAEINPAIVEPGFVVYKEGGYDGQFFYFLAKSLFSDLKWEVIVDSYFFRLHRIGFTLLIGAPAAILGFKYYPVLAIIIPFGIFISSCICLYSMLPEKKKWQTLFYIFSPFSLNSHLLLVADGVFTSLAVIVIFLVTRKSHWLMILLFLTLAIFTRELGVFLVIPLIAYHLMEKNFRYAIIFAIPFLLFFGFLLWTRSFSPSHLGTNPLGFKDMIDFPLFGFAKSFFDEGIFHLAPKESIKLLLFLQWIFLSVYLLSILIGERKNLISVMSRLKIRLMLLLPIAASLSVILFAEEGYWRSFDNLSRMFTVSMPLVILLNAEKKSSLLILFQYSSFILFLFLIVRIVFITKSKGFYLSP